MFDVVTTSIYRYARLQGGPDLEDSTLQHARPDPRMPPTVFDRMAQAWAQGMQHASPRPTP
ncbi:MAG: hypothetical protein ACT4NV_12130 [Rhodoferax sp.]